MAATVDSRLRVEPVEGVAVVHFADSSLTSELAIQQLETQLQLIADQVGAGKVLLNFRNVHFMSSAVLGVLLKLSRSVTKAGGVLKLCGLEPGLKEAFRASQLDKMFAIYDEESAALDAF